jgi:ribosomal protein L7/L12
VTATTLILMARIDYQALRDAGQDAVEVFRTMQADGVGAVEAIRNIRELFGLSLLEAKEVMVQAEGWEGSLGDYQEQVVLPAAEVYFEGSKESSSS